jgi:hypothetical protein
VVALLLLAPAAAAAHAAHHRPVHHPTTDPVTLAISLAERYWRVKPCGGNITVEASTTQPALVEGQHFGPALMWATVGSCAFTIDTYYWPSWEYDDIWFHWFCDGITHELGHLAPLDHSDVGQANPASIEYPLLEPGSANFDAVPECRHVTLWYGHERVVG